MITITLAPLNLYEDALQCIYDERTREHVRLGLQIILRKEFDEAQAKFPKRKQRGEVWDAMVESFQARAKAFADAWSIERDEYRERLRQLAQSAVVRPTLPLCLAEVVWKSSYSTQTQSEKYAFEKARQYVDIAEFHGLTADVITDADGNHNVYVSCSADAWTILKLKPGPNLKDWLRLCWKRGVNPRVYNPFLPHGLEEKLGIDYQGNEIKK